MLGYKFNLFFYTCSYTCINTLNSFYCICNFSQYIVDKTIITNTPKSHEVAIYAFYTYFIDYMLTIFAYILCWQYAQYFCHPSLLCWHNRLKSSINCGIMPVVVAIIKPWPIMLNFLPTMPLSSTQKRCLLYSILCP